MPAKLYNLLEEAARAHTSRGGGRGTGACPPPFALFFRLFTNFRCVGDVLIIYIWIFTEKTQDSDDEKSSPHNIQSRMTPDIDVIYPDIQILIG